MIRTADPAPGDAFIAWDPDSAPASSLEAPDLRAPAETPEFKRLVQYSASLRKLEDNVTRFIGCAVDRGDVLVYVSIGCPKANFEQFRPKLEKCIMSVRCVR